MDDEELGIDTSIEFRNVRNITQNNKWIRSDSSGVFGLSPLSN